MIWWFQHWGESIILATTARLAEAAARVVTVEYDDHKEPAIMSLAEAKEHALQYPGVDKQYVRGDVDSLTVYTSCQGPGPFMQRPRSGCGLHFEGATTRST
jgi:hypothetical protein